MARGRTRLLTWTPSTLRLFELDAAGIFQQLATAARSVVGSFYYDINPFFGFTDDGDLIFHGSSSSVSRAVQTQTAGRDDLVTLATNSLNSSVVSAPFTSKAVINSRKKNNVQFLEKPETESSNTRCRIDANGTLTTVEIVAYNLGLNAFAFNNLTAFALSHDSEVLFLGRATTGTQGALYGRASSYGASTGLPTNYGTPTYLTTTTPFTYARWTDDDRFLLAGYAGGVRVYRRNGAVLSLVSTITEAGLTVRSIRTCMDNRTIAVSFTGGSSTYTTKIYRRTGNLYTLVQSISDFGNTLDFSPDGSLLIDAGSLKAYRLTNGAWSDASSIMANVAAGAQLQIVGPYIENPTMRASVYDGALSHFIQHASAPLTGLKLAMLDQNAAFLASETSAANLLAHEVFGNNWPKGGVSLSNVVGADNGVGRFRINCDPVSQLIFNGDLSVRYALLYTGDVPLVFYDFQEKRTFLANTLVNFGTTEDGLVLFSA